MRKMPGIPFGAPKDAGRLSRPQKAAIARTLAEWQHSLSLHRFPGIGTPTFTAGPSNGISTPSRSTPIALGPPACIELFAADWRANYPTTAPGVLPTVGPLPSLSALASSLIACRLAEATDRRQHLRCAYQPPPSASATANTPSRRARLAAFFEQVDARAAAANPFAPCVDLRGVRFASRAGLDRQADTACPRLAALVEGVFGRAAAVLGSAGALGVLTLQHWDVNAENVLVDPGTGRVTGLLDWEHLYTVPIVLGCRYPSLMDDTGMDGDGEEVAVGRRIMRAALDQRLRELKSPWCATGEGRGV